MNICDECGCDEDGHEAHDDVEKRVVDVGRSLNEANDARAQEIAKSLESMGIFCVNIMGSPGAGKTTLIENVASLLGAGCVAVIQGDLESDIDKVRLLGRGIDTYQINTHSGCHLNADMVQTGVGALELSGKKFVLVENVGNLVCPAGVAIGQHMNVVVSSAAEGTDKPRKYPLIFMDAGIVVVSKTDISDACGFDLSVFEEDVKRVNPKVRIVPVCAKDGSGFSEVAHIIAHRREHLLGIGHEHK